MTLLLIPYPEIDPILIQIGPFAIRWYALAYIAGLVIGWRIMRAVCQQPPKLLTPEKIDDFLLWAALGVILGGRLGYVLFYKPAFFLANPLSIRTLWEGGMAFHGGLLGVVVAILAFSYKSRVNTFMLADLVAMVAPIGLFFGRPHNSPLMKLARRPKNRPIAATIINGELWGRPTDVPWAMIFPRGGLVPRHPSQVYQAFFEGMLLFLVLMAVWKFTDARRRPALLTGVFCLGYGCARIAGEIFREPDAFLGFLWGPITMGMLLSVPLGLFGLGLIVYAFSRPPLPKT